MPLRGFICPIDNEPKAYEYCLKSCQDPCEPLPLLTRLSKASREDIPGVWHVTDLWQPFRMTIFKRLYDYYDYPENLIWAAFGISFHQLMASHLDEDHIKGRYEGEDSFEVEIPTKHGVQKLVGRPDLKDLDHSTLWDWKVASFWLVKRVKDQPLEIWDLETTYHLQLNTYRMYDMPEAKHMKLKVLVRDHTKSVFEKYGIRKIETIGVPKIEDDLLRAIVERRIEKLAYLVEHPDECPDCQPEETWGGRRCAEYCPIKSLCPQYKEDKKGG